MENDPQVDHVIHDVKALSEPQKQSRFMKYINKIQLCNASDFEQYINHVLSQNNELNEKAKKRAEIIQLAFQKLHRHKMANTTTKAVVSVDEDDSGDILPHGKYEKFESVKEAQYDLKDIETTIDFLKRYHPNDLVYFIPTEPASQKTLEWCLFYNFLKDKFLDGLSKSSMDIILKLLEDVKIVYPPLKRFRARVQRNLMKYESEDCKQIQHDIDKNPLYIKVNKELNDKTDYYLPGDLIEIRDGHNKWVQARVIFNHSDFLTVERTKTFFPKRYSVLLSDIRGNEQEIIRKTCKRIHSSWGSRFARRASHCERILTKRRKYNEIFGPEKCTLPLQSLRHRYDGGGGAFRYNLFSSDAPRV